MKTSLGLGTKLAFGLGAVASGTLSMGVAFFSMVYYNAALGVPAEIVGLALAAALVLDAISDPLVGAWSDRLHSRWGRRHPFMYAAALPSAGLFWLFWNPPTQALVSDAAAFVFLFGITASIRLAITCFEVPMMALVPELTDDYDGRSELLSYHSNALFGWTAIVSAAMYGIVLAPTPEFQTGILNVAGYERAGWTGALVVLVAMLGASGGLHGHIGRLKARQSASRPLRFRPSDLLRPFRNRSFVVLLVSMLLSSAVYGTHAALFQYMARYFWALPEEVLAAYSLIAVIGIPIAFLLMPKLFYRREKKKVALGVLTAGFLIDVGPVALRLVDWMPANGTDALIYTYCAIGVVQNALGVLIAVAVGSLLAEVVDDHAAKTGEQVAGLISSTRTFTRKATSALGTAIAGFVLTTIGFPSQTDVVEVPAETIFSLGLVYGPILAVLSIGSILVLAGYRISRADHERNLATLAGRARETRS